MNAAEHNPKQPNPMAEAIRLLEQAKERHDQGQSLADRAHRLLSTVGAAGGGAHGGHRYKLQFGGRAVGRTVTLYRADDERHYEHMGRFDGAAAVFLQRLAALREIGGYLTFAETVQLFAGGAMQVDEALARIAHQKVRAAIHRALPSAVDHRDIVKSKRGVGYQLADSVEVTGEFASNWDPPLSATPGTSPANGGELALNENDRRALAMRLGGSSWEDIWRELDLGEEARAQVQAHLKQLAEA